MNMINFDNVGDGDIVVLQKQNDGSTRIIAKVSRSSVSSPRPDPAKPASWTVVDDKMNEVAKLIVAQALAVAYAQLTHIAIVRDLFRNHVDSLAVKDNPGA